MLGTSQRALAFQSTYFGNPHVNFFQNYSGVGFSDVAN